jgi:cytochrome c oxidase subunit 3
MSHALESTSDHYYVPHQSYWPIIASIGLFTLMLGGATWLNGGGDTLFWIGVALMLTTLFGWFGTVVYESEKGCTTRRWIDRSVGEWSGSSFRK